MSLTPSVHSVEKQAPQLVAPAEATPGGRLPLSSIDRTMVVAFKVELVLVFEQAEAAPAEAVRLALARALVPYYSVAGRVVESSAAGGEAEVGVECTGEGVWFVEAAADCSLEEVKSLECPLALPKEELLPFAPSQVKDAELIMLMQLTTFTCGGIAVGIRFSHTVFDGLGAAQFLKAVGEVARGHDRPLVEPAWCRDAIPTPPKLARPDWPAPSSLRTYNFQTAVLDVSTDQINLAKNHFFRETGRKCSTFDVITAVVWQSRTRAVGLAAEADVQLGFAANTRHLLQQVLPPEGFYGNCVYPMEVKTSSGRVAGAPLMEVIELIREAKEKMAGEFLDWMMTGRSSREDPYKVPMHAGAMIVSDWSRVGFSEVDLGWGEPLHVVPVTDENNFIAACIYLQPSKPKQGIRLMTRCVEEEHLPAFQAEMSKYS